MKEQKLLIPFADLLRLFSRFKRTIKRGCFLCGFLTSLYILLHSPQYLVKGTFQQFSKQNEVPLNVREALQRYASPPQESGAVCVLQSNTLLKKTVSQLGLQFSVARENFSVFLLRNVWENLVVTFGGRLKDREQFLFREVEYEGEEEFFFYLKPITKETFQVTSFDQKVVCEGGLHVPLSFCGLRFTLSQIPIGISLGEAYLIKVLPWQQVVKRIKEKLSISAEKLDKNVLSLSYLGRNRHEASLLINHLMRNYQEYLKKENEEICRSQLAYLERRQEELSDQLDLSLLEHVAYLKKTIAEDGYIGLTQEMEYLSGPRKEYLLKLFEIDLEIGRLEITLNPPEKQGSRTFPLINKELEQIDHEIEQATAWLSSDRCQTLSAGMRGLVKQFTVDEPENLMEDSHRLGVEVEKAIAYLHQKKETLAENIAFREKGKIDFAGLNLASSRSLLSQYASQQDELQAQLKTMIAIRGQLADPHFELSSISAVFSDPATTELLQKASGIALQINDGHNQTEKDCERLRNALKVQKSFLSQHLFQTIELTKLRSQLFEDKINALKNACLKLLHAEKKLLQERIQELQVKMGSLPEKWRRENLLLLKKELGLRRIEGMSQLVEATSVGKHLYQASSRPLDLAIVPLHPQPPRLFLLSLLAAVLGGLSCFIFHFCRVLLEGKFLSSAQLCLSGYPTAGELRFLPLFSSLEIKKEELKTLHRLVRFISSQQKRPLVVLMVGEEKYDYSSHLIELLQGKGWQVAQVPDVFDHANRIEALKAQNDLVLLRGLNPSCLAEKEAFLQLADAAIVTVSEEKEGDLQLYYEWGLSQVPSRVIFIYAKT